MPEQDRAPREESTRAKKVRKIYTPPALLPEVDKQEGYAYRWCRSALMGQPDPSNMSMRYREEWEIVDPDEQPGMGVVSEAEGMITIGGLTLMKTAEENMEAREKYYNELAKAQADSVDQNYMRENNPMMPLSIEKKSRVKFGGTPRE